MQDELDLERWINEGGHVAPAKLLDRERAPGRGLRKHPIARIARPRVLIAGAGVAGLETLMALRALTGDQLSITLLAPETTFVNRSMAVDGPFEHKRVRALRIEVMASELGADWHRGTLDRVNHKRRRIVTKANDVIPYDILVVAVGARSEWERRFTEVLTFRGERDAPGYRLLLQHYRSGRIKHLAFVRPAGATWPMPLYDLALMTAAKCSSERSADGQISFVTPEASPLAIFGLAASAAVAELLRERGVSLHAGSYAIPVGRGRLQIAPGDRHLVADRIVTLPRLLGPRLRGLPCATDGFIQTDDHGRIGGLDDAYAAGDATTGSIKDGGLATQQANAVAETIAASIGIDIEPQPFRPVLRGLLLTGEGHRYLRADISGHRGDDSVSSDAPLWSPPTKLWGRHLAPYLSGRQGDALDVVGAAGAQAPAVRSRR